jgi:hypothetical protein
MGLEAMLMPKPLEMHLLSIAFGIAKLLRDHYPALPNLVFTNTTIPVKFSTSILAEVSLLDQICTMVFKLDFNILG